MSWVERLVEQRIAEAIERGELDPGPLRGQPIADLDQPRRDGWWAEQFVSRERRRLAREDAVDAADAWRRRLAPIRDPAPLRRRVDEANDWVDDVNRTLHPDDRLPRFDADDVEREIRMR